MDRDGQVLGGLLLPDGARMRSYLLWSGCVALAFFSVYPTLNWITSLRPEPLHLYFAGELAIPFVPEMIWAYLSMYALFLMPLLFVPAAHLPALGKQLIAGTLVCGILFLLLPAELGFARELPTHSPYAGIYAAMFDVDRPHNLVPSLHVVFTLAIGLACAQAARPLARACVVIWVSAVVASTVLVHQHHMLDVAAALMLVFLLRRRYKVPDA